MVYEKRIFGGTFCLKTNLWWQKPPFFRFLPPFYRLFPPFYMFLVGFHLKKRIFGGKRQPIFRFSFLLSKMLLKQLYFKSKFFLLYIYKKVKVTVEKRTLLADELDLELIYVVYGRQTAAYEFVKCLETSDFDKVDEMLAESANVARKV